MKNSTKVVAAFILPAIIIVAFLLSAIEGSKTFRYCIEDYQYKAAQQPLPNKIDFVNVPFIVREGCWLDYIDKHAEVVIAIFTIVLTISTVLLWWATKNAANAARIAAEHIPTVERAYVKMSHAKPGLRINYPEQNFRVIVGVKNFGRTPARITDVRLKHIVLEKGETLPIVPDYSKVGGEEAIEAFLVADDEFFHDVTFDFVRSQAEVQDGTVTIYIIGYVDYIDQYGQRQRGGYARVYDAERESGSNNLVFVVQPNYNYDRHRVSSEGNDWSQNQNVYGLPQPIGAMPNPLGPLA
jgi:hypothetical protein